MVPKVRLDALTDGIYAVVMTLLVLDLRVPEGIEITGNADLAAALVGLWPKLFPYALSFFILAAGWMSAASTAHALPERLERRYTLWWLRQMFLVTCVPFTNVLIGRYGAYPLSVALFALNLGLMGVCAYRMLQLMAPEHRNDHYPVRRNGLIWLMASSGLTLVLSPWLGGDALYALLLNLLEPALQRWRMRHP